mmetsp:Transcript_3818/g.5942  ORF Transcript_3818/g.5942 Transcript_3818/m.5942 type:complete len:787 (+) Transcript_3818:243-2603(+)
MGYWRDHLGGSAMYVHSYDRKKQSHALRLINADSSDASGRSVGNARPPRRVLLLPHEAELHFRVVKGGAEVLGHVRMVKDVETRRAWKPGERPINAANPNSPSPNGADCIDPANAGDDGSADEDTENDATEDVERAGAGEGDEDEYAADDYRPKTDTCSATAVPIARPAGSDEEIDPALCSPVWGVITTPGAGEGRGDPEETSLLQELAQFVSDAKASIDRHNQSGRRREVIFSDPPPPVLPLSINPSRAEGFLSIDFGPEMHWELEVWDESPEDVVQIFVLSRRDPRRVLRQSRIAHTSPSVFTTKCEEALREIGDEEIVVFACDCWRLGGAMASAAAMLQSEFGSQMCSMDPAVFSKAAGAVSAADDDAAGSGANFCIVAYRGLTSAKRHAAEQAGGTFKGYLVLDVNTGMYGVSDQRNFTKLQLGDIASMRRRALDRESARTGIQAPSDQSIQDDMIQCQFQLSEHKAKLRLMYQHYCTTGAVGINNPFTMDFHQWENFVTEVMKGEKMYEKTMSVSIFLSTNVEREDWSPEKGFTAVEVASWMRDVKLDVPMGRKELENMTASRFITFDQWKEAIIRLAVVCYGGWEDDSSTRADTLSMAGALAKLLQTRVLTKGKSIAVDKAFVAEFSNPEVAVFLAQKRISVELKGFFACAAYNSLGSSRVGYRDWITFCKKAGFVGKVLSISKLLRIFVQVADDMFDAYDILDASEATALCKAYKGNQEEDMRYDEWLEGLARVGYQLLDPGSKKGAKERSAPAVIEEVLKEFLIRNEISIRKMKQVLR